MSLDDDFWNETLALDDLPLTELDARIRDYDERAEKAERELNTFLDGAVQAGKLTEADASARREKFYDRLQDWERRIGALRERAKAMAQPPKTSD
ncbi:MAG TPA: hypothetical protein VKH42_01950 [Vicinamibacterales bacterium]|nr:hypothetical protein [Vicinamibacterales bacterium]